MSAFEESQEKHEKSRREVFTYTSYGNFFSKQTFSFFVGVIRPDMSLYSIDIMEVHGQINMIICSCFFVICYAQLERIK